MTQFVPLPPGIPFSWEKAPGVPRKQSDRPSYRSGSGRRDVDGKLLPPPAAPCPSRKKYRAGAFSRSVVKDNKDPFFAAFMRCTRPPDEVSRGFWIFVRRTMGSGGGFVLTGHHRHSCKQSYEVLNSVVYLGRTPSK